MEREKKRVWVEKEQEGVLRGRLMGKLRVG